MQTRRTPSRVRRLPGALKADGRQEMNMASEQLQEPDEVLYRIKRGLSGYVSYLAACEMNESFNEYVLHEP